MLGNNRRAEEKKLHIQKIVQENNEKRPANTVKKAASIKKIQKLDNANPTAVYCRYCQQILSPDKFYSATNIFLDKNGKMSICSTCIQDIYDKNFMAYQDMSKAMFLTCQDIDLMFDEGTVAEVKSYFESNSGSKLSITCKYKRLICLKYKDGNIRFRDTKIQNEFDNKNREMSVDKKKDRETKWGTFTSDADYEYLEEKNQEYTDWISPTTPSEKDGIKTLALLYLRQRNEPLNKDVTNAIKEQQKLCGISPDQLKKEKIDKGSKTLGCDVAFFESGAPLELMPEWEDENGRFKDYDGLLNDKKDIVRNMRNFFTGSRDFDSDGIDISLITDGEAEDEE